MNIAFDARYIEREGSGVSVYAYNILKHISGRRHLRVFAIATEDQIPFLPDENTLEKIVCPHTHRSHPSQEWWLSFKLPSLLKKNSIDVLFCPAFIVPIIKPSVKMVVMIHDLAFRLVPFSMNRRFVLYASFMTGAAIKKADFILTPTEAVKKEIMDLYRVSEDVIGAVHHGKTFPDDFEDDASFHSDSDLFLKSKGISSPYFLHVGNLEPRKDIVRLVKFFQHLRNEGGFEHYQLVLCGKKRWKWNAIKSEFEENSQSVLLPGYVEQRELEFLYKGSDAVFAASLYEGFGLPVLEGMQAGKVVFASDIPSFREVGGDGAVYINLDDFSGSAEAVRGILKDEAKKNLVIERAEERTKAFFWEKCADKTIEAFKKV